MKTIDINGVRFNSVVVTGMVNGLRTYRCDCGNTGTARMPDLTAGKVSRCRACSFAMKRGVPLLKNRIHGQCSSPEYTAWRHMIQRCNDPAISNYPSYGGRGITVCERWMKDVLNFVSDMGKSPSSKHSLDRIDNNGNYCPENCQWATKLQQSNNTRRNRFLKFEGKEITMAELARISPVSYTTLRRRLGLGWTVERAVSPIEVNA